MCTSIKYESCFGRNLDIWCSYNEEITVTPRNYINNRYAMIGVAMVIDSYPLYYEAMNEAGLAMAGLNFPGNAVYYPKKEGKRNLAPFELIPYIIGNFTCVADVKKELCNINIEDRAFSPDMPLTPLHWMISDKECSVVLETTEKGMQIYDNDIGVMTNNPTFDIQCFNLNNYINLTNKHPENRFPNDLKTYSLGMGALGLPGDLSSMSRFVRAAFHLGNSRTGEGVGHFMRLLDSVSMPRGSVILEDGRAEYTLYSCCCELETGRYYYKGYEDLCITCVNINDYDLDANELQKAGVHR